MLLKKINAFSAAALRLLRQNQLVLSEIVSLQNQTSLVCYFEATLVVVFKVLR